MGKPGVRPRELSSLGASGMVSVTEKRDRVSCGGMGTGKKTYYLTQLIFRGDLELPAQLELPHHVTRRCGGAAWFRGAGLRCSPSVSPTLLFASDGPQITARRPTLASLADIATRSF